MQAFEFISAHAVFLSRIVLPCLLRYDFFLEGAVPARTARVEWRLSNAWKDESCTNLCKEIGFRCTEKCWPTSANGVREMTRVNPFLQDVCFDVQAGRAAAWHPAKDPENTLCYWDAGPVSGPRCSVVPSTPVLSAVNNKLIRRFCPCFNASSTAVGGVYTIDDCGVGSAPVADATPVRITTAAPASSSSARRRLAVLPVAASSNGCGALCVNGFEDLDADLNGDYSRVDAAGSFSHWHRQGAGGSVGGSIQISKGNGRWRFLQVTAGGGRITVAESKHFAHASAQVPLGDTYTTPGSKKYELMFYCCGVGSSGSGNVAGGGGGLSTTALVLGGLAILAVAALLCVAAYLRRWSRTHAAKSSSPQGRAHFKGLDPTTADFAAPDAATIGGDPATRSPQRSPTAAMATSGGAERLDRMDRMEAQPFQYQVPKYTSSPVATWNGPAQASYPSTAHLSNARPNGDWNTPTEQSYSSTASPGNARSNSQWTSHPQRSYSSTAPRETTYSAPRPLRRREDNTAPRAQTERSFFTPPPIRSRYTGASSPVGTSPDGFGSYLPNLPMFDQADFAMSGHAQLRGAGNARYGHHDDRAANEIAAMMGGAVAPWSQGAPGRGIVETSSFEEGLKVRIVGLENDPTWDGAEGEVDGHDEEAGMVRIVFADGRIKSVSEANCEPCARMPRRQAPSKVGAGGSSPAGATPSPIATAPGRGGRGGLMARPQGSAPLNP